MTPVGALARTIARSYVFSAFLLLALSLSSFTLTSFGQSTSAPDVLFTVDGSLSDKEWNHGIGGGSPYQEKCYGHLRDESCAPVSSNPVPSAQYEWDITFTSIGPNAKTGGSYIKSKGRVGEGLFTFNHDLFLKWVNEGGLNFGWPFLSDATTTVFYVKGPAGTPFTMNIDVTAQYQAIHSGPFNCSGFGLSEFPDASKSICPNQSVELNRTAQGTTGGPALFYNGQEYHRVPHYAGGFEVDQNGSEGGTHLQHLTVSGTVRVCPGNTACSGGPPVVVTRGPVVNGNEVEKVTPGSTAIFESKSYDPDNNQGTTPLAGIAKVEWAIVDPAGLTTTSQSFVAVLECRTLGTYTVTQKVTDDEGATAVASKTFDVEEELALTLQTVSDADPNNPNVYYTVKGTFDSVEVLFGGKNIKTITGPVSNTVDSFTLNNLSGYPRDRHTLMLRGHSRGRSLNSNEASVDTRPDNQSFSASWPVYVLLEGFGLKHLRTTLWTVEVYKWEWSLPGARWDRRIDGKSDLILKSLLPANDFSTRSSAGARLTLSDSSNDDAFLYQEVEGIDNGDFYIVGFEIPQIFAYGKSGKTKLTLNVTGSTCSGDCAPWTFFPLKFNTAERHLK